VQQLVNELYQAEYGATEVRPDIKITFDEFATHPDKGRLVLFELNRKVVGYACAFGFLAAGELKKAKDTDRRAIISFGI
jgi:hypothetical protein